MFVLVTIVAAYAIGSIPIAYLTARATKGIDIRDVGSGNAGASNIWQSVSRGLVAPVGLAQIAQGAAGPLLARATHQGDGVIAAAAVAAVLANDWNPWLRFTGGRGIGQSIGALGVLSPVALVVFVIVALLGVVVRAVPQLVALALVATPVAAAVASASPAIIAGCALLAAIALAKRVTANAAPDSQSRRMNVVRNRLLLDRDIADRDAWVRRTSDL